MTRALRVAAVLAALALGWLLAPTSIGGSLSYVTTYGISMEPGFHAGDLGLLRVADGYAVGDVVGYRSATLHAVVLHRIVGVQGDAFVMKGDHNTWLDVDRPTAREVVGRLVLRVPAGGAVMGWLLSPAALVLGGVGLAGALVLAGRQRSAGQAGRTRGRRPRRRRHVSADPLGSSGLLALRDRLGALGAPSPRQLALLAGTAVLALLGAVLLLVAQFGPVTQPTAGPAPPAGTMTFSYTAAVPGSPAFDGTSISSPDPVFRKLANVVVVHYAYHGRPGVIRTLAALYGQSGWHSALPLPMAGPMPVSGNGFQGDVPLDLEALGRRAAAAAAATGSSDEQVGVQIIPRVQFADGTAFAPALTLTLTRQQLAVTDAKSLVVADAAPRPPEPLRGNGSVSVLGHAVAVGLAQRLALILLGLGLLLGLVAVLDAVRAHPPDEVTVIRRRYAHLLVPAEAVDPPPGRPLVELTGFATLARLARSYGLLVMQWEQDGAAVFVVWDDAVVYRYRVSLPVARQRTRRLSRRHRATARSARPTAPEPVSVWARSSAGVEPAASAPVPSAPFGRRLARRAGGPRAELIGRRVAYRGRSDAEQQLIAWKQQQRQTWADLRRRRPAESLRPAESQRHAEDLRPGGHRADPDAVRRALGQIPAQRPASAPVTWDDLVTGRPG